MKTSTTEYDPSAVVARVLADAQYHARRRRGVRRTTIAVGIVAVSIYAAFILSGVIGR